MAASVKAKYIFVDPGVRNLGILFLGFTNNKVQLSNHTLDCSNGRFQEIANLDKYVADVEKPFYFFVETNYFANQPELTKKINTTLGALQFYLIDRFKLGPKDFHYYETPATAIAQYYSLTGDRQRKKEVILKAFHLTFKAREVSYHEADAFAAGVCIILNNSKVEVESNLRELALIFDWNVRQISQSDSSKNNTRKADAERWLRTWRSEKRETSMLADVPKSSDDDIYSFKESP